jgi:hypothetical protein
MDDGERPARAAGAVVAAMPEEIDISNSSMSPGSTAADADDGRWRACEEPSRLDKLREEARAGRQRTQLIAEQVQAAFQQAQLQWQQAQATWNRILASQQGEPAPAAGKDVLRHSAYARLVARLGTMPVIEQAKGIIMARSACSENQAFDTLRLASQRLNMPVRDLAARIVDAASRGNHAGGEDAFARSRGRPYRG